MFTTIAPSFGRLVAFDPRLPHGVSLVPAHAVPHEASISLTCLPKTFVRALKSKVLDQIFLFSSAACSLGRHFVVSSHLCIPPACLSRRRSYSGNLSLSLSLSLPSLTQALHNLDDVN